MAIAAYCMDTFLPPEGTCAGADLLALEFKTVRKAGEKAWLELDNVQFYVK